MHVCVHTHHPYTHTRAHVHTATPVSPSPAAAYNPYTYTHTHVYAAALASPSPAAASPPPLALTPNLIAQTGILRCVVMGGVVRGAVCRGVGNWGGVREGRRNTLCCSGNTLQLTHVRVHAHARALACVRMPRVSMYAHASAHTHGNAQKNSCLCRGCGDGGRVIVHRHGDLHVRVHGHPGLLWRELRGAAAGGQDRAHAWAHHWTHRRAHRWAQWGESVQPAEVAMVRWREMQHWRAEVGREHSAVWRRAVGHQRRRHVRRPVRDRVR